MVSSAASRTVTSGALEHNGDGGKRGSGGELTDSFYSGGLRVESGGCHCFFVYGSELGEEGL